MRATVREKKNGMRLALQLEGVLAPPDFHIQLAYQDVGICMPMDIGYHDASAAGPGPTVGTINSYKDALCL